MKRVPSRRTLGLGLGALTLTVLFSVSSCRSTYPNRVPVGEAFPSVVGKALTGEEVSIPTGEPTVLLLGYVQDAQFDADRWLIGLLQAPPEARVLEVPTVAGLVPRLIAGTIDSGMRSGIPEEDWGSVATVYGEPATRIAMFTGNERPRNIRVLLVNSQGEVTWFHDRGFSAGKLLELQAKSAETR